VFALVLTDGFSPTAEGVFSSTAPLLAAAGEIPVLLFTAHQLDLAETRAAGFAGVIPKLFEIDRLSDDVRAILSR
jgi:hypothetical protein